MTEYRLYKEESRAILCSCGAVQRGNVHEPEAIMSKTTIAINYACKGIYTYGDIARILRKRFGTNDTASSVETLLKRAAKAGLVTLA